MKSPCALLSPPATMFTKIGTSITSNPSSTRITVTISSLLSMINHKIIQEFSLRGTSEGSMSQVKEQLLSKETKGKGH
jgi:hypothetical protein